MGKSSFYQVNPEHPREQQARFSQGSYVAWFCLGTFTLAAGRWVEWSPC